MEQVADNVFIETSYEGVNVGAILTSQGIIAIDTPTYPRQAREWATRLQSTFHQPLLYLILTDYSGERILNTRWFNAPIIVHEATADKMHSYDKRYPSALLENISSRNPARSRELSGGQIEKPTMSFSNNLQLLKGDTSLLLQAAPGPTKGNLWVYLPQRNLLFTGDSITAGYHPLLQEGISQQWLETVKKVQNWEGTRPLILPGRGAASPASVADGMVAYLSCLRGHIQAHIQAGKPREDTAVYIPQLLTFFPNNGTPTDWLQQQLKLSLDHVYDEIQLELNREEV